jgi:pimeloyl-ACP methyl ester carboxylesterase
MPFMDPRRSVQSRLVPLLLVPRVERIATRRLATVSPEALAQQVIDACFAKPELIPPARIAEAVEEVRRRYEASWFMDAYLGSLRGLVGSFLRAYLPGPDSMWRIAERIVVPTLVVTGRQDRLVDVRVAPAVGRLIPDSRLLVLDQVGHVAQMERPDLVARGVLAMLDEVAQSDALVRSMVAAPANAPTSPAVAAPPAPLTVRADVPPDSLDQPA